MTYEPKTIAEHLECLARLTSAPDSFVSQVEDLFLSKGISLDDDAEPYLAALDEAFRREENIRCTGHRAKKNIQQLQDNFQKIGKAYVEQISKLKRMQSSVKDKPRESQPTQVTIKGDHRTYVTRPEREHLPMVPGPKEVQ